MKKQDILRFIEKELQENSEATSLAISQKYNIPFILAEIYQIKLKNLLYKKEGRP
ncbi:hypothetical protein HP567_019625 [Brevibacillus sp. M2.1A]|uniref:hypothetical protein n=1 Tax=Brevibacillus TaxID=55080 RepID=UPI00156ABD0F|nr:MULTISPECIES: hypothetical protein [Brevibacillus]MBY0087712.1 hypothetical protein [Brevibacillus brevis]MCC8436761.1 hypothetical protein [Brevibacillus sp. M2.1A]MCE0448752.1 hypothetical protein [Brevibacillus sp. AF8]